MAYVDLNPIRAAMATTPEKSDYTSIQERIRHPQNDCLAPLREQAEHGIPFSLKDYLELVDWSGRAIKNYKRGYIPTTTPPILRRLQMDAAPVLGYLAKNDLPSPSAIGPLGKLRAFAESVGQKFIKGHALGNSLCPEKVQ
jgi:hypothetical protein